MKAKQSIPQFNQREVITYENTNAHHPPPSDSPGPWAIAMALTLSVSALASANEPYNVDTTKLAGSFSSSAQTYSATVSGPMGTTKTKIELTLYEKGLLGYKEVDSASASANSRTCSKTVSYAFKVAKL